MGDNKYKYDAFICYRQLPTDKRVAQKLQNKLERFTPPYRSHTNRQNKGKEKQKKLSLYLDQSEYSAGGDLYGKIDDYLAQSRYLIFICSKETKDSATCLYEIRRFKEIHNGKLDHVLVVLLEGNPGDVMPEELTYENCEIHQADGSVIIEQHPVNLIRCDIKADNEKAMLKELQNQFLRLAAPLLNCEYDDLFQRHLKREAKRKFFFSIASLLAVFAVSAFLYWLHLDRKSQAITYELAAERSMEDGDWAQALMYYGKALEMNPNRKSSQTGALLLLQQHSWPCLVKEQSNTSIWGNTFHPRFYQDENLDNYSHSFIATVPSGEYMLWRTNGTQFSYIVTDKESTPLYTLDQIGQAQFTDCLSPYWTFYNIEEKTFIFYWPEDRQTYELVWDKENYGVLNSPAVRMLNQEQAVINDSKDLYLYELNSSGGQEIMRIPLTELFIDGIQKCGVDAWANAFSTVWVSPDGSLLAVYADTISFADNGSYSCWSGLILFNTETMERLTVIENSQCVLQDIIFSSDGKYLCLLYSNWDNPLLSPCSFAAVYEQSGTHLFSTEIDYSYALQSASFCNETLLIWDNSTIHFWDIRSAQENAVPLYHSGYIAGATITEDGLYAINSGLNIYYYELVSFTANIPAELHSDEFEESTTIPLDQPMQLTDELYVRLTDEKTVLLYDEAGSSFDTYEYNHLINYMTYYPNINSLILLDEQDNLYCLTVETDKRQFLDVDDTCIGAYTISICPAKNGILSWNYVTNYVLYTTTDLFDPYPNHIGWLAYQENSGAFLGMTNDFGNYAAFVIYDDINKQTIIEIRDMKTGKYLNKFTLSKNFPLDQVGFISDGLLAYTSNDEMFYIQAGCPKPNSRAVRQLLDISGCTLNENQRITANPVLVEQDNFGNWSNILTWTSE